MTGERWSEQVSAYDEVIALKKRVFKKKGIAPSRQAMIFAGNVLSDQQLLITAGLRNESVIKFVVITRSGPVNATYEEISLSDDPSDWEIKGKRMLSTAEDTSAKESGGETEVDDGKKLIVDGSGFLQRKAIKLSDCFYRRRTRSQTNPKDLPDHSLAIDIPCSSHVNTRKDYEEHLNNRDRWSEGLSEISEVSSGMLVCDLTNEFRKIKKHRHPLPYHVVRQRNRSKTRDEEREVSSSDESESIIVDPSILSLCPQNPHRRAIQRLNASSRCTKCAFKLTNPFFCRCGKTLCPKHRSHTCPRQKTAKLQEVSD